MKVKKYQEGGSAPVPAAPAGPQGGQDPLQMLAEMAAQALQTQDCQAMAQVCEGFLALLQQAMSEGPQGPVGQGPVGQVPEGEPVFKKGGKMVGRKKCAKKENGGEMKNKFFAKK